jgi:hypothetical protein
VKTKPKSRPFRIDSLFEAANFVFECGDFALGVLDKRITGPTQNIAQQDIEMLGLHFARLLKYGHPQKLRDIADALDNWREATRPRNRLEAIDEILITLPRLFPRRPKQPDPLVQYRTREIAVRDVLANLRLRGFEARNSDRKQIERRAVKLGIDLDHSAGRPKKPKGNCDKAT